MEAGFNHLKADYWNNKDTSINEAICAFLSGGIFCCIENILAFSIFTK